MISIPVGQHSIQIEKIGEMYRVQILNSKGEAIADEFIEKAALTSAVWQLM